MEEEDENMDYHSMKRKQLQALCKRHGIPANLSNSEMADLLCSIFKEKQKVVSQRKSSLKNSAKKVNGNHSKLVKKVRFSPENQTMFYELSGYKRAGRTRASKKSLSKKQNQAIESEVLSPPTGKKRARRDLKKPTAKLSVNSAADCDANAVRGVIVGEDAKLKNFKSGGRITRSRAQSVGEASQSGELHQLDGHSKVVGRTALAVKSSVTRKRRVGKESLSTDGAESDRVLRRMKRNVTQDEGFEIFPENSLVGRTSRVTRSQAKTEVVVSDAVCETGEETIQLAEPGRSLGRYASRRKSVVVQTGKVGSKGLEVNKEIISIRSRSIDLEESLELEAIIEPSLEHEKVKNVVIPSGPKRRTRRSKSTVRTDEELEIRQTIGQKDAPSTEKLPRRSSRNVVEAAEADEVLQQKEQGVKKDEGSEILSGNKRKFKSISRITRSQTETAGKVSPLESEIEGENMQHEEPSKGRSRYASRRNSIVHQKRMAENNEIQEKKETRKRSSNTDLERALEAIVEPTIEIQMLRNVSDFNGPNRRSRRNTVMIKSSASVDRELETDKIVGQEDALMKDPTWRFSRTASRNQSTVVSSEVNGISLDSGKVRQQKRKQEPALDEDISATKSKILEEQPLRRSARNTSKNDTVESAGKPAGKKHQNRSRKTIVVQEVPPSDKVLYPEDPMIEDARLVGAESARNKDKLDASCSKQVLESSSKKRNASQMKVKANKKLHSVHVSTVISDPKKAEDTAVSSEETLNSTPIKQLDVSTDQVTLNSASSSTIVLQKQCSLVGDEKIEPLLDETYEVDKHEIKNYVGKVISSEITSPAVGLFPANQSNDLAEPSNVTDLDNVLQAEEPSIGKNINHGSNNEADHSNKDDIVSVQECQNLVQLEDVEDTTAAPDIQEADFEEQLDELSRSSPGKESELLQEAEERNVIDPSDEGGNTHSENFLQAIEIHELTAESHPLIIETATEIQLISHVANAAEATCERALENEEVNKAETQSLSILTGLEIGNEIGIEKEEPSGKGIVFSDEIVCRGETSIGTALCGLAKTEDGVTSYKNKLDETVHNERASQVDEESLNDGYEQNLLVGGSSIFKTPGKDDTNKEREVSTRYSVDAVEKEHEDSEKISGHVSLETRERCTLELSDAKEVNLTTMEERAPSTADKVDFTELAQLKCNDELGKVSSCGTQSSSFQGKQSLHNGIPEELKEKLNEVAENVLKTKVQAEHLPQFALEDQGNLRDANGTSGQVCDFVTSAELQVSADVSTCKTFPTEKSDTSSGSELGNHVELAGENHLTVGIVVERTADVVTEEKAESEIKVELVDISDEENVASQVKETASKSLTEIISKECEVPDEKTVGIAIEGAGCKGVGEMKVEEFKAEDDNSNAEVIDVSASAKVHGNLLVEEEEATEKHDDFIEMIITATKATTKATVTKTMDFSNANNGETSIGMSPVMDMTFTSEFVDVNDPAPGLMNEAVSAHCNDKETRLSETVSSVPHIDEEKFGDLENHEENVLELQGCPSITSDKLISTNNRAADKEANIGDEDWILNFKDNYCDAHQEDNVDAIPQITENNSDDCLLQVGLYTDGANIGVAADDAGEISMKEKADSQNTEDNNEWAETPNLSQTIKNETKWDEKNSTQGKPEIRLSIVAAAHLSVLPFPEFHAADMDSHFEIDDEAKEKTSLRHQEDKEDSNDPIEDNAKTRNEQLDDHKTTLLETASIEEIDSLTSKEPSCSNRQKSIAEVGGEGVPSEKLSDMIVTADIEKLHPVSSSTPRMTVDCSAFSQIIVHSNYGITENKSSEFHIDSPRLTSWEMSRIFGSRDQVDFKEEAGRISEANLMAHYCENAMEMKENLVTGEQGDQQDTEKWIGDQEHHTHLDVLDDPPCDKEELKELNGLLASNPEYVEFDLNRDKFNASAEKVVLAEAAASCDSVIDDLGKTKAEFASVESKEAENIVVDPDVYNCSGSRGVATDMIHREASKLIDMVEEIEYRGTTWPVEHCENTKKTSDDIAETIHQRILSSGKEIFECEVSGEEYNNGTERPERFNEDTGKSHRYVISLFSEDNEAATGECDSTDRFGVENNVRDPQEVVEDEFDENERGANEANSSAKYEKKALEDDAKSHIFTSHELNLFSQPREQDETKNSNAEASDTNAISEDAAEIKETEMTIEQVAPQVTEEHQQEHELAIIHGTPNGNNCENESLKLENTNSSSARETAPRDAWRCELNLLSPQNESPDTKVGSKTLFAKKLNSSVKKENSKRALIQKTPKLSLHDMKENALSTMRGKTGNVTTQKALSKRRALGDLQKK